MSTVLPQIEHVVVLMLENRSLDNVLGWLWADTDNTPRFNHPPVVPGNKPTYDGLVEGKYSNINRDGDVITASRNAASFESPKPDPEESFANINTQIFGATYGDKLPPLGTVATMSGFVHDYEAALEFWQGESIVPQIMAGYTPEQLPVLNGLARSFAVSDRWFASTPTQTNPNRAFMACGTSLGKVNNTITQSFDVPTIWNVFDKHDISWKIYHQDRWLWRHSYCEFTFPQIRDFDRDTHFPKISAFYEAANNGTLPAFTFIEPAWFMELDSIGLNGNSYHPYGDVRYGERTLNKIYNALTSNTEAWLKTLFVVVFDEHGGIYDHVPTPWGATPPDDSEAEYGFGFDRFGVRVPAILISPWVPEGMVFRTHTGVPYEHTSILKTLLNWKNIDPASTPLGKRMLAAPCFSDILSLEIPRQDIPRFEPVPQNDDLPIDHSGPLSDHHRNLSGLLASSLPGGHIEPTRASHIEVLTASDTQQALVDYVEAQLASSERLGADGED